MSKTKKLLTAATTLLVLIAMLSGCATTTPPPSSEQVSVTVVATRDFGNKLIFGRVAEIEGGDSAQEALREVAKVGMAGSYIEGIEGIYDNQEYYWFYYINGVLANVFASGYKPHDGDIEHWDFHDWSYSMHGSSAIIGDFPEPFLHGYAGKVYPTVVAYTGNLKGEAERLKDKLEALGIEEVSVRNAADLSGNEKELSNLILVCTSDFELVAELNEVYDRLGLFAHFENGKLKVLNAKGKVEAEYGAGSGVIQATQSLWNPKGSYACENVTWMVSGIDEVGVKNAVDALLNHYPEIRYAFAVVVADGKIIRIPL
jgi:hypothetical protein